MTITAEKERICTQAAALLEKFSDVRNVGQAVTEFSRERERRIAQLHLELAALEEKANPDDLDDYRELAARREQIAALESKLQRDVSELGAKLTAENREACYALSAFFGSVHAYVFDQAKETIRPFFGSQGGGHQIAEEFPAVRGWGNLSKLALDPHCDARSLLERIRPIAEGKIFEQ